MESKVGNGGREIKMEKTKKPNFWLWQLSKLSCFSLKLESQEEDVV
jgi:hypothetical protein